MYRKIILLILSIFFLTTGLVTSGGCGLMGILDTNPYDDSPPDDRQYRSEHVAVIRQQLLGLSKNEVLKLLGKPTWVNDLGDNYQMVTKFRENEYVFDGTKKCRMSECGPIFADESWSYGWERKTKQYRTSYGYGVFFKKGVVVSVQ